MSETDKFWDKAADKYAKKSVPDEAMYNKKLAETQSYLSKSMRVLEFGCGTGTTAIHHAPYVQHIDAVDTSQRMVEIGREKASAAGVENVTFSRGTLAEFGAESASMDMVLGLNVIHLLPDRASVLAEVARILKPGGLFVSSTGCLGASYLRFIKIIEPLGKLFGFMPYIAMLTEAELASEISNLGFQIESQWNHGMQGIEVFIVARKIES